MKLLSVMFHSYKGDNCCSYKVQTDMYNFEVDVTNKYVWCWHQYFTIVVNTDVCIAIRLDEKVDTEGD